MDLGANIRKARELAGLTQEGLAERLGTTQIAVSRWERNDRTPNVLTFGRLCEAVGVSADEMLEIRIAKS